MKKIVSLLLAALMVATMCFGLASCNTPEAGGETGDWAKIQERGYFYCGITLYEPMNYYNEDDVLVGFEGNGEEAEQQAHQQRANKAAESGDKSSKEAVHCLGRGQGLLIEEGTDNAADAANIHDAGDTKVQVAGLLGDDLTGGAIKQGDAERAMDYLAKAMIHAARYDAVCRYGMSSFTCPLLSLCEHDWSDCLWEHDMVYYMKEELRESKVYDPLREREDFKKMISD